MPDKTLTCVECGKEFIFTEGEQKFYEEKGFQEPHRCKECRQKAKERRAARSKQNQEEPVKESSEELKAE